MAILTYEKRFKVHSLMRNLKENHARLQRTVCELMAHPDATNEQIDVARKCLMDLREKAEVVRARAAKHNINFKL